MAVHIDNRFQTVTAFREALGWNVGLQPRSDLAQSAGMLEPDTAFRAPVRGRPVPAGSGGEPLVWRGVLRPRGWRGAFADPLIAGAEALALAVGAAPLPAHCKPAPGTGGDTGASTRPAPAATDFLPQWQRCRPLQPRLPGAGQTHANHRADHRDRDGQV